MFNLSNGLFTSALVNVKTSDTAEYVTFKNILFICGGGDEYESSRDTYLAKIPAAFSSAIEVNVMDCLKIERHCHSLAVLGDSIYAIGGKKNSTLISSVEIFNDSKWRKGPELPEPLCDSSVCAMNSKIYIFGGKIGPSKSSTKIYVLKDEKWNLLMKTPDRLGSVFTAIPCEGQIMLLCTKSKTSFQLFNPETKNIEEKKDLKLTTKQLDFKRNLGVNINGNLFLISGRKRNLIVMSGGKWTEISCEEWSGEPASELKSSTKISGMA